MLANPALHLCRCCELNHSLDQMPLGTQLSHQHHRRKAHIAHTNAVESIFQKPCSFIGQNEEEWAKSAHTYAYGMQIDHGQLVNGNENTKRAG